MARHQGACSGPVVSTREGKGIPRGNEWTDLRAAGGRAGAAWPKGSDRVEGLEKQRGPESVDQGQPRRIQS